MSAETYITEIKKLISFVESTQIETIHKAAELVATATLNHRLVYIFGAGHSNLIACDCFARAGGLINFQAIMDPGLDFMAGARRQSGFERLPGYVRCIVQDYDFHQNDVVFIVSNSGRNPAPVQMALEVKKLGVVVIALTSLAHSRDVESKDPSGMKLYEVADLVLDNGGPAGDALVQLPGLLPPVGPGSTVIGALIMNSIVVQAAQYILQSGGTPPVAMSGNLESGKAYNENMLPVRTEFFGKMRHR